MCVICVYDSRWRSNLFLLILGVQNLLEAEWLEGIAKTLVEFAHELDPVTRDTGKTKKHRIVRTNTFR